MTSTRAAANTLAIQQTDLTTSATQEITNTETFATTWLGTTSYTEIITANPTTSKKQTTSAPVETTTEFMMTTEEGTEVVTVFDETTIDITPETTAAQTEEVTDEFTTLTTEPTNSRQTTKEIIEPGSTRKITTRNLPITERTTYSKTYTPTEKPPSQLSAGAIAGIAIGSLLFFVLIIIVLYIMCYKRKSKTYNLNYIDQEFIMEYVNRGENQKYTGYWKEQEIQKQNNKSNQDGDGTSSNNDDKTAPPIYHINNALSLEEGSTNDTNSEGDQDTTREDETTFDNYQMEPIDMAEIKLGGTERFI